MLRVACLCSFIATTAVAPAARSAVADARASCTARVDVHWIAAAERDGEELDRWCRAVGPPLYVPTPAVPSDSEPPPLEDVVVITWNAHLAAGRLDELVEQLRDRPFIVLAQELFRRQPLPALAPDARAARAIHLSNDAVPDAPEYAATLGVSMLYVPAVRNGAAAAEDRGNAIVSSQRLLQPLAYELPFERQRRVAIGAAIEVMHDGKRSTLRVFNAHLENLSAPRSLWVFRNPRTRQMDALLGLVSSPRFEEDATWAGTILGGDFNTVKGGEREAGYRHAREWSTSLAAEDRRGTHFMGRLDYLLFRLAPGLVAHTIRLDDKFGSDHNPVIGRFTRIRE